MEFAGWILVGEWWVGGECGQQLVDVVPGVVRAVEGVGEGDPVGAGDEVGVDVSAEGGPALRWCAVGDCRVMGMRGGVCVGVFGPGMAGVDGVCCTNG